MNTINNLLLKALNVSFFAIALLLSCDTAHAWKQYVPTEEEGEMTILPIGGKERMQRNVRYGDERDDPNQPIYLDPTESSAEEEVTTMEDVY